MNERTQNRDSILALVMDSVKSPGLWSFVTAAAGIIALITGAILHFLIIEIRDFSITVIVLFLCIFIFIISMKNSFIKQVILSIYRYFAENSE